MHIACKLHTDLDFFPWKLNPRARYFELTTKRVTILQTFLTTFLHNAAAVSEFTF